MRPSIHTLRLCAILIGIGLALPGRTQTVHHRGALRLIIPLFLTLLLAACRPGPSGEAEAPLLELASPAGGDSGEPNLFTADDGTVYLSWIANGAADEPDSLRFATWRGEGWSAARTVAAGSDWFVNWADFPSLAVYPGTQTLAAHWLARDAGGDTYDYNVMVAQSIDGGRTWGIPFRPHTDGIPAEHGFVSLLPLGPDRMMAVWLDGRFTKQVGGGHGDGHDHGGGAMTLRTATFDPDGRLYDETELDHRICDCCQTDAVLTGAGPLVVYRDRSEDEIRDIYVTRRVDGRWTEPRPVARDNWRIAGCPVNGPAADAVGAGVVIAWFSSPAEGGPQVKVAFSDDAGAAFGEPVRIDGGRPAGRVDAILLAPGLALVTWLENTEQGADIRAARVSPKGIVGLPLTLARTNESRQSGFPVLTRAREDVLLAWTHVDTTRTTRVRVGKVVF